MNKMKVTINNLGAVKNGTFELKPLTVFIGNNNSGKTWAAYGISSIVSSVGWSFIRRRIRSGKMINKYPIIETLINTLYEEGNAKFDIVSFFRESGISYFNDVAKLSSRWMNIILATDNVTFDKLSIKIDNESDITCALNELLNTYIDTELSPKMEGESIIRLHKEENDPLIYLYISEARKEEMPKELLTSAIYDIIFHHIHYALYSDVRYLPAERTGVVALIASETNTSDKSDESIIERRNVYSNYMEFSIPLPIKRMINSLSIIKEPSRFNSALTRRMKDNKLQKIMSLADILEKEIMGGVLEFEEKPHKKMASINTNPLRKLDEDNKVIKNIPNLYYKFKENPEDSLELPVVSSSVKDLMPLSVYLKCYLCNHELLIIDEPEMNLHPENQAKIIEFLVMLVNSGVNVILTTHSPYMTNHLESLIKAYDDPQQDLEKEFYLQRKEAFISKENVSVYYFRNNSVENILDEDGNIDLSSFSKVSRNISEIYYKIE